MRAGWIGDSGAVRGSYALWCCVLCACLSTQVQHAAKPSQTRASSPRADATAVASASTSRVTTPSAKPWPEGTARFRSQGPWLGADSAYSIDLGSTRVLWLFGDTFLDPLADGSRENGPNFFVRNTVAIQSGPDSASAHDLSRSTLAFAWGPERAGAPSSFFHDIDAADRFIWPLHGARLPNGKLLLFRMQIVPSQGGLGFRVDAWDAVAIDDPELPPERWQPRAVAAATRSFTKLVGASVLIDGSYLYAYAVENDDKQHAVFLVRWPLSSLAGLSAAALADPEWFTTRGFVAEHTLSAAETPSPLFLDGQTEFSVHYEASSRRFVEVQIQGLFVADAATQVAFRTAPRPEGPWTSLSAVYRPAESALPEAGDLAVYAAKAHPEQRGAQLVVTYVVNDLKRLPPRDAVYYPQVLQISQFPAAISGSAAQSAD